MIGHEDQVCRRRKRGRERSKPVSHGCLRLKIHSDLGYLRTVAFVVEEKKHSRFERMDDDLVVKLNITLSQALLGPDGGGTISKEVEQLDGRRIQVSLPEGVSRSRPFATNLTDIRYANVAGRAARSGDKSRRRGDAGLEARCGETEG